MRKTRKIGLHSPIFCDRIPTVLAVPYVEDLFFHTLYGNLLNLSILGLTNKPQPLQLTSMFHTGGNKVDTGGFDAGMAQYVRQLRHIPAGPVEGPGK